MLEIQCLEHIQQGNVGVGDACEKKLYFRMGKLLWLERKLYTASDNLIPLSSCSKSSAYATGQEGLSMPGG